MKYLILSFSILWTVGCSDPIPLEATESPTPEDLVSHSEEFRREVIEVTEGVHVAVGFALANAILVEGENSNIIIDTTGTVETAREVKEIFYTINSNPLEVDMTIPALANGGAHLFSGSIFVGRNYDSDEDLAAAGISGIVTELDGKSAYIGRVCFSSLIVQNFHH